MPLVEDVRLLKSDEQNPNRMTLKQQDQVWRSLQKYGWTYPIITNKEGVFADGDQRSQVCLAHGGFSRRFSDCLFLMQTGVCFGKS